MKYESSENVIKGMKSSVEIIYTKAFSLSFTAGVNTAIHQVQIGLDMRDSAIDQKDQRIAELEGVLNRSILMADIQELVEQAFMAGQADCGVDPSYSSANNYANKLEKGEL